MLYCSQYHIGAPLGRYPGGLDLPLKCELYDLALRHNYVTDEEIVYLRTWHHILVSLTGTGGCGPLLGNMDARGADGALFDRVGEWFSVI